MKKKTIYIMVGCPGSGKSYYAWNVLFHNSPKDTIYISSDRIRAEICGSASDQSRNNEVFALFYNRAREAIITGNNVILDATHLTKKSRRKCRNHFKNYGCKIIAVQMDTPIEEAIRRNRLRERVVPSYAMSRMINSYEPVGDDEGFDEVWHIK